MKHSIGVEAMEEFQNGYHDINRLEVVDREQYCRNVFLPLSKLMSVQAGSPKCTYKFRPASEKQSECIIDIFASNQEEVKYTDDEGCQHQARVVIRNLPKCDTDLSREIELCVNFYNTEVEIEAYSMTNNEVKERATVDYVFLPTRPQQL